MKGAYFGLRRCDRSASTCAECTLKALPASIKARRDNFGSEHNVIVSERILIFQSHASRLEKNVLLAGDRSAS